MLWKKQHWAADLPLFERCVSLSGICQRIGAVDPDGNLSLLYPRHKPLKIVRVFLEIREAVRTRKKQRAFFLESHQINGRNVAAGLSVDHQIASGSKTIQIRLKRIFPYAVIHNANSPALCYTFRFLGDIR